MIPCVCGYTPGIGFRFRRGRKRFEICCKCGSNVYGYDGLSDVIERWEHMMSEGKPDETLTPEQIENWRELLKAPDLTDEEVQSKRDNMQDGIDQDGAARLHQEECAAELCVECGANFQGAEIPEESRHHYGNKTHFSRKIGIYDRDRDMTVAWQCPDCKHRWPREMGEKLGGGFRIHD